jgi:iron complex outermembrane receptor protein
LTNRFGYTTQSFRDSEAGLSELDPVTGIATRDLYFVLGSRYVVAANLDLKGTIDTGPLHHSVLLGTDYFSFNRFDKGFCCTSPFVGPINIYFPVYNGVGLGQFTYDMNNYFQRDREAWKGIYAQDQISFADDRLHILIGGRYDWANFGTGVSRSSLASADAAFVQQNDSAFSPRVGAVVQPLPWLSFYGNYSQSFGTAGTGFPSPGEPPFPPQLGIQYEGGMKAELLDGRLSMTMAYYDITKTNILAQVPGSRFSVPIGEARSKGVEFDIAGRINENWSLIGSYSHDDARVTRDSTETGGAGNTGNRLASVPLNAGNLWVKYDADGALRGLSLGGGLNVVGQRQGDLANTFQLPAYTLVNAMIMYRFQPVFAPWVKNLTAQLNITNLTDVTYFQASSGRTTITPGVPRTFLASVRAEF